MKPVMVFDIGPWCTLVRSEFDELPRLRLTLKQAQRLWSVDKSTCRHVLDTLVRDAFLAVTDDGQYCRADCLDGVGSLD